MRRVWSMLLLGFLFEYRSQEDRLLLPGFPFWMCSFCLWLYSTFFPLYVTGTISGYFLHCSFHFYILLFEVGRRWAFAFTIDLSKLGLFRGPRNLRSTFIPCFSCRHFGRPRLPFVQTYIWINISSYIQLQIHNVTFVTTQSYSSNTLLIIYHIIR